ncbi:hypothetical protein Daus18300_006240 [Diaporthe australafricana]|uniref:CENP-V/GFA domain-containing protein n=1 Tax=Diaporthe australafricana TaxID=127596 RepID=A0ABR3WVH9_9PEZI
MAHPDDSVQITAQCLCKRHTFTCAVPRSSLPLKAAGCHCTSCRRMTGALYSMQADWPGDQDEIRGSTLKKYDFSHRITVLSCGTCSCIMFFAPMKQEDGSDATEGGYAVFTGTLSNDGPEGLVRIDDHIFVGDTKDGGASMWMRNPNGDSGGARRWFGQEHESEQVAFDWPGPPQPEVEVQNEASEIPIRCHCGGVDLVFQRQKAEQDFMAMTKSELPWFVDPTSKKLMASVDPCDSCRLSSGVDFWAWTFVLLRHIGFPSETSGKVGLPDDTKDLKAAVSKQGPERDSRLGTLGFYASSADVQRYFCSRCSASVFYAVDDRPELVDVAVGLLDSATGARAESLLCWSMVRSLPKFVWREDMMNGWRKQWLESVEAEAEAHRRDRK